MADKILKGQVDHDILRAIKHKKFYYLSQGKNSSDITVEKWLLKKMKQLKKNQAANKPKPDEKVIFKFKKEPEKNKTHWDHLLEEMKWMYNDFGKERRVKKKNALDFAKAVKKSIENKHIDIEKNIKRQELELKRKTIMVSRYVNNYWKKILKLIKHHYKARMHQEKMIQQQNKLVNFINRLQKISNRVADSLTLPSSTVDSDQTSKIGEDNIVIVLKKLPDEQYSLLDICNDENYVADAAHKAEILQPKGTSLNQYHVDTQIPFLLKYELREYQLIGLDWLRALHDNRINGILADEMGLGKTIQTIALISYLACFRGVWGPHLIVVPTTIILNWEIEFKRWCPALKILSYYGNQKERKAKRTGWHKANSFNVCITSYKLVIQDYSVFKRKRWYYLVLDEAQNIKNFKSKRWQMLLNIKAKRKLLLTGTPLQNDIMEIWSYLHFLMPNLFYSNEEFRDWFYSQFYEAIHNNASLNKKLIQTLHSILRPFLLRRLKKDVEKQLPEKIEHVIYCNLTRRQRYLYDEYINSDRIQNTLINNDYFSIMNVLMQLRKVCNHPDLFEARDYVTSSKQMFNVDLIVPYLVLTINNYDPLKTINYKTLFLLFTEFENYSKLDYIFGLSNFPYYSLAKIYQNMINGKQLLYTSKYNFDENEILFKRQYADATIIHKQNLDSYFDNVKIDVKSNYKIVNQNILTTKYITPTNIPILQNSHLDNYYDLINERNSIYPNYYLNSCFNNEIYEHSKIKNERKLDLISTYDNISRKNVLMAKPLFGSSLMRMMKMNTLCQNVNNQSDFLFRRNKIKDLNLFNTKILNKFATNHYHNSLNLNTVYEESIDENNFTYSDLYYTDTIHHVNTEAFQRMIYTPQDFLNLCGEVMDNFRIYIPTFISSGPKLIPSKYNYVHYERTYKYDLLYRNLNKIPNVQKYLALYKNISFPDRRLIEYDSGKLIKLGNLLKMLKQKKSKVLIFTQMTRMLDILEIFLNIYGHTYVRLDGSTKVEVRQQVVDKFNNDQKVFCFISSTRAGGIGLNLTGADSIVFLDTDWNPAMDKQAQDRCHRIGQSRTVNIYRLITASTIEENIFKKSIQKRELNYIIMEDGHFDIENFAKINFKSIVDEEHLIKPEKIDERNKMLEFENIKFENEQDQKHLEEMLIKIEDEEDVAAMKNATKEILDEYEQEVHEKQFLTSEGEKAPIKDTFNDSNLMKSLKKVDLFALRHYQNLYTYEHYVREKEMKSNISILSEGSVSSYEDDYDGNISDEDKKVNKMDIDEAYKLYLQKKNEIYKTMNE